MVIYADVYIILNFTLDLIALDLTARLAGAEKRSILLAAAIAAVYSAGSFIPVLWAAYTVPARVIAAACVCGIAYRNTRRLPVLTAVFYAVSSALAGFSFLGSIFSAIICSACAYVAISFTIPGALKERSFVEVSIYYKNKKLDLKALLDTGNELHDPITGKSVIVTDFKSVKALFDEEKQNILSHHNDAADAFERLRDRDFRLIPYKTVSGGSMMLIFKPDRVSVAGRRRDSLIGITYAGITDDSPYSAIAGV